MKENWLGGISYLFKSKGKRRIIKSYIPLITFNWPAS